MLILSKLNILVVYIIVHFEGSYNATHLRAVYISNQSHYHPKTDMRYSLKHEMILAGNTIRAYFKAYF